MAQLPPFLAQAPQGLGISLPQWQQPAPLIAEIIDSKGNSTIVAGGYSQWIPASGIAVGTLRTNGGGELYFEDAFYWQQNELKLQRTVTVRSVGHGEKGFSTRFVLGHVQSSAIHGNEFFMPGVWYKQNQDVATGALASDPSLQYVIVREDRLPLPLVMTRDPNSGLWACLEHQKPDGTTIQGEDVRKRIIDERLQFGSLGVMNAGNLQLTFMFPGSEGEVTYLGSKGPGWAHRHHPLRTNFSHTYQLSFIQGGSSSFAEALQISWRHAFDAAAPVAPKADRSKVYNASIELLGTYIKEYDGVPSVPFQCKLPNGEVADTSSQMGFVGKATLSASCLMAACLDKMDQHLDSYNASQKDTWLANAEAIIDFWVKNSMTASGVPKNWYNIKPGKKVVWRDYATHLRIASDGVQGILTAWKLLKKPEWLEYCEKFGSFLVQKQNPDGSFDGVYDFNGNTTKVYKNITHHAIPFLVELSLCTGNDSYKTCALRAGEYAWNAVHLPYRYSGGAADNPNVMDKESGVLAFSAFNELYKLTKDQKWLAAAIQAATYCETWTFAWNVPLLFDSEKCVFPRGRNILGGSLIASGQSGADNYMAATVHLYKHLHHYTHDHHFHVFSKFLADATSQLLNWDGTLGYKYRGLLMEAYSPVRRGTGVTGWLPWLTCCVLEPFLLLNPEASEEGSESDSDYCQSIREVADCTIL